MSSETVCAKGSIEHDSSQVDGEQASSITLRFPFAVDGADRTSRFETTAERVQEHISFALPFDLDLCIRDAALVKKEFEKTWVVYVFEFSTLDSAIEWMVHKLVDVELKQRNGDLHAIQKEMDDFMTLYEEGEGKKRKKKMMVDDEGFTYYE